MVRTVMVGQRRGYSRRAENAKCRQPRGNIENAACKQTYSSRSLSYSRCVSDL